MAKYINADEAIEIARERYTEDRLYDLDEYSMLLYFLDTMPAADVVEVVRCKDCKKQNECGLYLDSEPEWFCADAERRESE